MSVRESEKKKSVTRSVIHFWPCMKKNNRRSMENNKPPTMENDGSYSMSYSIDIGTLEKLLGPTLHYDEKEILGPMLGRCCIYRVPIDLRKIKPEAYTPQVISIGPLHHGNKELIEMEKHKLRYVSEFCKRIERDTLIGFKKFIEENEKKIDNCYAEYSNFEELEFVSMILCDAVFVVELVLKYIKEERDYFLTPCIVSTIQCDLLLLIENQLPLFVLEDLYKRVVLHCNTLSEKTFLIPFCKFLRWTDFESVLEKDQDLCHKIQHLTDLGRHYFSFYHCTNGNKEEIKSEEENDIIPCATRLHGSGVKFSNIGDEEGCLTDIRCEYAARKMLPIPWFQELKLRIPVLKVYDPTECWIRNMMAFEMCHYPQEHHVCDYIRLMDHLIEDRKDVDLLVDKGIIINHLGDNAAVTEMFNNLCLQITVSKPSYLKERERLKQHYNNNWNHAKARLKMAYFDDLWTGTATVAAVILLLLTLIQAISSVLPLI